MNPEAQTEPKQTEVDSPRKPNRAASQQWPGIPRGKIPGDKQPGDGGLYYEMPPEGVRPLPPEASP